MTDLIWPTENLNTYLNRVKLSIRGFSGSLNTILASKLKKVKMTDPIWPTENPKTYLNRWNWALGGFWGHWSRFCSQNWKIHNNRYNIKRHVFILLLAQPRDKRYGRGKFWGQNHNSVTSKIPDFSISPDSNKLLYILSPILDPSSLNLNFQILKAVS